MSTTFIPGLVLCERFYHQAVRPLLDEQFPRLVHSAACLGTGSEVLGFDTPLSTDHGWGPRVDLFVSPDDRLRHADALRELLSTRLPRTFAGYSTHWAAHVDEPGIASPGPAPESGPINPFVRVTTPSEYWHEYLRADPYREPTLREWLLLPEQQLRTVRSGRVFYDGLGELEPARRRLHYYPHDLWLWLMASQWERIGQEEAFVGRCGDVGDELGSRVIAARLVRDLMRLCFLLEQQYAPYSKWFGTAFARLKLAPALAPLLEQVLGARDWRSREAALAEAYRIAAQAHNALGLTPPLPEIVSSFHNRPYLVIHAGRFAAALRDAVADPAVRALPFPIGKLDQWADSTDAVSNPEVFERLGVVYRNDER